MRRFAIAAAGFLCAAAVYAAPAAAYAIDPLTREPLINYATSPRAQATAVPREVVSYSGRHPAGTIVISTSERRLYYVLGDGRAIRYGVGVGRPGFEWGGVKTVTRKAEWPDWRPPPQMLRRRPDLPRYMSGGPDNPLGARALYLGSSLYRIHGSNEPETIGQAVSSGCFRMTNEDVTDLYSRVRVGARVIVQR
jgi:lipoprotein-anchoring transpeptidase ErfK/SrfK